MIFFVVALLFFTNVHMSITGIHNFCPKIFVLKVVFALWISFDERQICFEKNPLKKEVVQNTLGTSPHIILSFHVYFRLLSSKTSQVDRNRFEQMPLVPKQNGRVFSSSFFSRTEIVTNAFLHFGCSVTYR
jgi:hypothetical protein